MEGFQAMEGFSNSEKESKEFSLIRACEHHMSTFKKMPNSRITPEDYKTGKIEQKRYNTFRSNYFQVLIGDCELLLLYMDNAEYKKEIQEKLAFIMGEVREQAEKGAITEELIDEMDGVAKDLLKKIKSKMS